MLQKTDNTFHQSYDRSFFVDFTVLFFGISSWIGVNGIFVELPLLVRTLPEQWKLPAYLSVAIQIANIGPILYSFSRRFHTSEKTNAILIGCLLVLGVINNFLLAFFYDSTAYITGSERSISILILGFFNALLGCSSSVLFYPYMGNIKNKYLITYVIGEGLSGLLPSIVALIQGIGGKTECVNEGSISKPIYPEPLFNPSIFFFIISLFTLVGLISFLLLHNLDRFKNEKMVKNEKYIVDEKYDETKKDINPVKKLLTTEKIFILLMMAIICALGNGFLQGIQSYSCLPYGENAYHLSATLGMVANPVACFSAAFFLCISNRSLMIQFSALVLLVSYVITTAAMSPDPIFDSSVAGTVVIVSNLFVIIRLFL